MIVISDTSSLYYAAQISCSDLFPAVFREVIIPEAVRRELFANRNTVSITRLLEQSWLKVETSPKIPLLSELMLHLDRGESEAIVLALTLSSDYLLIDERRGNKIAEKLGVNTVGLLGFLLLAKEKGVITEVKPWVQKLTNQTNFRYNQSLIETVLKVAGE